MRRSLYLLSRLYGLYRSMTKWYSDFEDIEHIFFVRYGFNPQPYQGESETRIAYREIIRLRKELENEKQRQR